ncbi:proprotein convertase subtilisin/kexin type 5 [Megalops cyprinoides]|uniref:proprotein convertase subtilisin/kexin type 5 n=1 Tax=Megalops cyprinoides TaxID=118141 RepID=UPI001865389C|nr:proprotein convertase subtilisin/kexin type 5 [Megalops cyprinoides]
MVWRRDLSKAFVCVLALWLGVLLPPCKTHIYTNRWAVKILGGTAEADRIAGKYGFTNLGQIGDLKDHYQFSHHGLLKRSTLQSQGRHSLITMEPKVQWVQQQVLHRRVKRQHTAPPSPPQPVHFTDPEWANMWYMVCTPPCYSHACQSDMKIQGAWGRGYSGRGVVVTILDDGIERSHADLVQNYDSQASFDINGNDQDPTPRYNPSNDNKHGTRCAGQVAASANNSLCGVGVAFNARIGGVRMLDGDVTDVVEAWSLSLQLQHIDIYSASWGPDDDGQTVDGPGHLARLALKNGVRLGREGRGAVFVWASGNGGQRGDHCSCDGYTNSIYTISISSTSASGRRPCYLEECTSTLATTYSSGDSYHRKIVTTDLRQGCTDSHSGSSASAPIAAGIIALTLEANSLLTWRDIQHLIVRTARRAHLISPDWQTNGAGYHVSHLYGFGLMDAEAMVKQAEGWTQVPAQRMCVENTDQQVRTIHPQRVLRVQLGASGCWGHSLHHVHYLEHVVLRITITHPHRGDLSINLISPSGTKSQLLANRLFDHSVEGFRNWEFMTTHSWGEKAAGNWTLEIHDSPSQPRSLIDTGKLTEWSLVLYGTSLYPYPSLRNEKPRAAEPPAEEEQEYNGACDPECDEFGCNGPGAHQCIGCLHNVLKNNNNTRTCVSECPHGFFADSRGRCKKCYFLCETCTGFRSDQCTSCWSGHLLKEGSNRCVSSCGDGYYRHNDGGVCRKCSENCRKCTSSDYCTDCSPGLSLQGGVCQLLCESGTFYRSESRTCEACHPACAACAACAGEAACTRCAEGFLLEDWRCVPSCSQRFFPVRLGGEMENTCQRCDLSCLTCVGPGAEACSSCVTGFHLQSGRCAPSTSCKDGEYQDEFGNCHLCDPTCHLCTGPEAWDCISCPPDRSLHEGRCDAGCSPGKYLSGAQCHLCDHTCAECLGGGPHNCTSCDKGNSRYLLQGQCVAACPDGHFPSQGGMCEPCPVNCMACSTPYWCLRCSDSYYPSAGVCTRLECGEGEVEDPEYGECMVCEEGCRKCVLYNPRHCLSCTEGFYQFQDSCYKTCPAKTYSVEEQMVCESCAENCISCNAKDCFWCEADLFLSDGKCVEECRDGFYGDEESRECMPCREECVRCRGPEEDDCESCEEDEQLQDEECVPHIHTCPGSSFLSGEGECESCHSSCDSCWGGERNQCSTCVTGRFLTAQQTCEVRCPPGSFGSEVSGRCESCPPGCALCAAPGRCESCQPDRGTQLYLQDGQCVRHCHRGYPSGQECRSCAAECASCRGSSAHCLSCVEPFVLHGQLCSETCPPAHFPRAGRCHTCPPGCQNCTGDGLCAEPQAALHDGACLPHCPTHTFHDPHTRECRDCDASCLTCSGPHRSSCTGCREGSRLDPQGHCVPHTECPSHSYRDPQGQCQPCHAHCLYCSGPSKLHCLGCHHKHFLLNGTCVDDCPAGFFRDTEQWHCERCPLSCLTCVGRLRHQCLTCKPHLFREDKACVDTCQPSYYGNVTTGTCERCDPSCGECSGRGDSRCLSCRDGHLYLRTHGNCRLSCPPGYYPDTRERTCERCHSTCKTCTENGFLACDSCHMGYTLSGGMCESQCTMGQYPASEGPGPYNCTTCAAPDLLSAGGRCLPCCGNESQQSKESKTLPLECCNCTETDVFLFKRSRSKDTSQENVSGYKKLGNSSSHSSAATGSRHQEEQLVDLTDREDEEDIVYMGQDGTVYRKFKYGQLGEEGEEELEYEDENSAVFSTIRKATQSQPRDRASREARQCQPQGETEPAARRDRASREARQGQPRGETGPAARRDRVSRETESAARRDRASRDTEPATRRDSASRKARQSQLRDSASREVRQGQLRDRASREARQSQPRDRASREARQSQPRGETAPAARQSQPRDRASRKARQRQPQGETEPAARRDRTSRKARQSQPRGETAPAARQSQPRHRASREVRQSQPRDSASRDTEPAARRDRASREARQSQPRGEIAPAAR